MRHLSLWHRLIILLITILPLTVSAQEWQWGKHGQFYTEGMAVDPHGNTYVLWSISDQANIDGHALACHGNTDMALTSFTCDGAYRWTKIIGGEGGDGGTAIATDSLGGIYISGAVAPHSGQTICTIHIDSDTTFSGSNGKHWILLKYDTSGNFQWLRMPEPDNPPTNSGGAFDITIMQNGNLKMPCLLKTGLNYANGAYTTTYPDSMAYYAMEYNKDGVFQNAVHLDINTHMNQFGTFWRDLIYDPVIDQYYLSGIVDGYPISFGNTNVPGHNFIACFNNAGNINWVQHSNNNEIPPVSFTGLVGKPATDNSGNVYVTGYSYNDANNASGDGFGAFSFYNTFGTDGFPILVKLSPNGNVLYAVNAATTSAVSGEAVSCSNGVVAVAGEYGFRIEWDGFAAENTAAQNQGFNVFLARLNANTGTAIGLDTLASSLNANDYARLLESDKQGNFYLGGTFSGTLYVGNSTLYYQGNNPITNDNGFIAKFGSAACNCSTPTAGFSFTHTNADYSFTYNGSTPLDSIVWDFGDGQGATGNTATHTYTVNDTTLTACVTAYNDCGSNQSCQQIEIGTIGIDELPGFEQVRIYPNPATNTLFLKGLQQNLQYRMYNSLGAEVQEGQLKAPLAAINMAPLTPGWYLLELQNNKGNTERLKVIKQ